MASIYRLSIQIPSLDTTFLDNISMGFTVQTTSPASSADFSAMTTAFSNFFANTPSPDAFSVGSMMANQLDRGTGHSTMLWYDITTHLSGLPHGSPVNINTWTLSPNTGTATDAPGRIAMILAVRGDYGSVLEHGPTSTSLPSSDEAQDQGAPATHTGKTRPRATLRGRTFIGPLTSGVPDSSGHVTASAATVVVDAYDDLSVALAALTNSTTLVVWSRANASVAPVSWRIVPPIFGSQRRRVDPDAFRVHQWAPLGS